MVDEVMATIEEIAVVRWSDDHLASLTDELEFVDVSVELLTEVGKYIFVATSIYPEKTKCWSRNQAIVGGQMIRLYKLLQATIDQSNQRQGDIVWMLLRLAFETIVNTKYLLLHDSDEIFDSFIHYSLRHEKKLHNMITDDINSKNSPPLPIANRILRSIQNMLEFWKVSIDEIDIRHPKNWANKNTFEKAKEVGHGEDYLVTFGTGSAFIHGSISTFSEIFFHESKEGYTAGHSFMKPRPQPNTKITQFAAETVFEYFQYLEDNQIIGEDYYDIMFARISDLIGTLDQVNEAHEKFLNR